MSSIHKLAPGFALCLSAACAHSQVSPVDEAVRSAVSEDQPFSGELEYSFDRASNRTTARFSASLRSPNILVVFFLGSPNVHTLEASYDYPGRRLVDPPDFVRLTFHSHEVIQADPEHSPPLERNPNPALAFDDWAARYPLAITEKTEDVVTPDPAVRGHWRDDLTHEVRVQRPRQVRHIYIERTATAWIPTGEFVRLVSGDSIRRGEVAGLEFRIGRMVILGLREFAAQMKSATGPH